VWAAVHINTWLDGGQEAIELAALCLSQVPCERVEGLLQPGLSGSGHQIAQRGAARAHDVVLEQPGVCGAAQAVGARRAASNAREVFEQQLPLATITAHEPEVPTNALEMGPAGLFIARVVGDGHWQQA